MKSLLIVYDAMAIGGSTTSLLSVLSNIDYNEYKVDLALRQTEGELFSYIPKGVNILKTVCPENIRKVKMHSFRAIINSVLGGFFEKIRKKPYVRWQLVSKDTARLSKPLEKEYDVAISFIEFFPMNYVSQHVKAKKKITWFHIDYLASGCYPSFDRKALKVFDKVVLVSEACENSFDKAFPEYKEKSVVVENMLSSELLKKRSQEFVEEINIDETYVNFVSVCRIDNDSKALDRALNVVEKLIVEGYKIKWYIVGDGKDKAFMETAISEKSLENNVFLVGSRVNPFPLLCKMDLFFLPSRFEGKPMSVTEAQILGVPPVVTNYATAKSQVNHSFDGYILENNDEGIYNGLKEILDNQNWIEDWKKNLSNQNYDNMEEMEKIYRIIEEKT